MNTLRKIRKNTRALSPVVASIILIAVTVAVSVAVAAWMGALTVGFMATEEGKVTSARFIAGNNINVTISNTGTSPVKISEAWVNGQQQSGMTYFATPGAATDGTVPANSVMTVNIPYTWVNGNNYNIQLKSVKGNTFPYTASAPSS
jgi:flagellin-like protein